MTGEYMRIRYDEIDAYRADGWQIVCVGGLPKIESIWGLGDEEILIALAYREAA